MHCETDINACPPGVVHVGMTESIRSNAAQCRAENAIVQLPASRIHVRLWYGVSKDQTCFRVVLTPPRSLLEPPGWVRTWVLMVASSRVLKRHLGMPRCRGLDCIGTRSRSHAVGDPIHQIVAVAVPFCDIMIDIFVTCLLIGEDYSSRDVIIKLDRRLFET